MIQKILSVLIGLFWIAVLGYLIHLEQYAVVVLCAILLGMGYAISNTNDN